MMKVGLIGAGTISKRHLSSYAKNPYAQVVAIADLNEALAKERAEEFGIKHYYTDYKKILENPEIDAVSIVTPTFTHSNIAVEALKAGKHVLCENPRPVPLPRPSVPCRSQKKQANCLCMPLFAVSCPPLPF